MSARSAQRTRWRRWRMGWDIAGRKDRDRRHHEWTQVVGSVETSPLWPRGPLLLLLNIKVDTGRPLVRVGRVRRREPGLPGAVFDLTAVPRRAS